MSVPCPSWRTAPPEPARHLDEYANGCLLIAGPAGQPLTLEQLAASPGPQAVAGLCTCLAG